MQLGPFLISSWVLTGSLAALPVAASPAPAAAAAPDGPQTRPRAHTVRGTVQTRPGGPLQEAEVAIHPVPTDLPTVPASRAPLEDQDLVLGVTRGGASMAFPIRFLSMFEVVDHRVGGVPVAPSW
ncbi:MAG: hypothetical protein ACE5HD_10185 [Acidobacteriota bacterium]